VLSIEKNTKARIFTLFAYKKSIESIIEWEGKNNLAPENTQRKVLRETFERNFLEC
jgi:hypothetical protein